VTGRITGRAAIACGIVALGAFLFGLWLGNTSPSGSATVAVAIGVLAAGAVVGFLTLHSSHRSIDAVSRAAVAIGDGDLRSRVDVSSGATQELEHAFNTMAHRVQELVDDAVAEHSRLEAVFDAAADGFIALADDTSVCYLNVAARKLLKVDVAEALHRPFIESARDYELDELVRDVNRDASMQTRVVTYGPDRLPIRAVGMPINGGGDWAVLLVLNDLTEVQRVDQVRRDFLSNVSHELRTPLASVRVMVETIGELLNSAEGSDAGVGEFVRRSLAQLDRLAGLVDELLDLSRIESGAIDLHPEEVDLMGIVNEAADSIRGAHRDRAIQLVLPTETVMIECDKKSVARIASNLLDNAIKYSSDGTTVTVVARDEGEVVSLAVHDQGAGIAPEDLPRVFERFYKADASRSNAGVGLGLAIVKHLVRAHRGTVVADSGESGGTTFTVRLPRKFLGVASERPRRGPASLSA
jgi:two-component system phosphate regulon sensor histidine kinase PhoR